MLKYIYQDILSTVRFLPYGVVMGAVFSVAFLWAAERVRQRRHKTCGEVVSIAVFWIYVSVMLIITFFSREGGSREGMDLELFSTWGINDRNNAYVVENVLLFIPYGFLGAWTFRGLRCFFFNVLTGFATSLCIELAQLATRRGYFQIDDILTNTLGAMIGYLVFRVLFGRKGQADR